MYDTSNVLSSSNEILSGQHPMAHYGLPDSAIYPAHTSNASSSRKSSSSSSNEILSGQHPMAHYGLPDSAIYSAHRLSDGSEVRNPPSNKKQVIKRFFSGPHPFANLGLPDSAIPSRTSRPAPYGSMSERKANNAQVRAVPYGRI